MIMTKDTTRNAFKATMDAIMNIPIVKNIIDENNKITGDDIIIALTPTSGSLPTGGTKTFVGKHNLVCVVVVCQWLESTNAVRGIAMHQQVNPSRS